MIALPSLAGVPSMISSGPADQLAARCVLALAQPGPIPRVRARRDPIEHALLKLQLEARFFQATRGLRIFRPSIHVHLGDVPGPCDCCAGAGEPLTVWIPNHGHPLGSRWTLERRWHELERSAPGLAPTALRILGDQDAVPLYTPRVALAMAQWTYWRGEADERWVLEEYREGEEAAADETEGGKPPTTQELAEQLGVITRAQIDAALPPAVHSPALRLSLRELERLATGRGAGKDVARHALALHHALSAKPAYSLHNQAEETIALGYGATLRWNRRDPMYRILDDHANNWIESGNLEEAWGWFVVKGPGELGRFFAHLDERFAIARRVEDLIEAFAERTVE